MSWLRALSGADFRSFRLLVSGVLVLKGPVLMGVATLAMTFGVVRSASGQQVSEDPVGEDQVARPSFEALYETAEAQRLALVARQESSALQGASQDDRALQRDADAVRVALQRAEDAFVALQAEEAARWLAHGGHLAFHLGDYAVAAGRFLQAIERLGVSDYLVEYRLRALGADAQFSTMLAEAYTHDRSRPQLVANVIGGARGFGIGGLHNAAGALLRRGQSDIAIWHFERVVETSGEHGIALGNLALALRSVGEVERAEEVYRRSVERSPDDHMLWNDFGLFLRGVGRVSEALDALQESRAREPAGPKSGPAIGNLIDLQAEGVAVPELQTGGPEGRVERALSALAPVLAAIPERAWLTRRRTLDLLLGRSDGRERTIPAPSNGAPEATDSTSGESRDERSR